ncbi:MAG TPA: CheR family methyltransferase [Gemmatimonadaceae bacterium]|nr:CheR family methyltransferase [Gemmatimonadaceae bacterium]
MAETNEASDFEELLELVKRTRGIDFKGYKRTSLVRRFNRRMQDVGVDNYRDYIALLKNDAREYDHLVNAVLINVTSFFRDSVPWKFLAEEVIPRLISEKPPDAPIRAWSAGCATGQETFSLAMMLGEALDRAAFVERVKIYGTDLDDDALAIARAATYTEKQVEIVPPPLLAKYFDKIGSKYVFRKEMRRRVIFGRNDLIHHAPISRIDLLICRNTLMYFDAATQAKIVNRLHFALNENGYLVLGKAETLTAHGGLFEPVDVQQRVFRRVGGESRVNRAMFAPTARREGDSSELERIALRDASFERTTVATFVVNRKGYLALANERARALFRLGPADIGRLFHDLEVSYRPIELRSLIEQIFVDERPVNLVEMSWPAGTERWFDVHLVPLYDSRRALIGVTVSFDDVTAFRQVKLALQRSHADLQAAFEELQSTNEELETTNEELQSTNEELETTNEELQSTNEELETMNAELQAINEEHEIVNARLRASGDDLQELNSRLESIFASLKGGVAIIDSDMQVKIWNRRAEEMWGIRSDEAVNRNFLSLDIGLPVDKVEPIIDATMGDGMDSHQMTLDAVNRRGRKIRCKVTSTPLLKPESDAPQGAILVMEEIAAQ